MKFIVISLFPEMFEQVLGTSMLWKAQDKKLVEYELLNLRDFGLGPRKTVDDTPYGGGDGMLLMAEPLFAAVEAAKAKLTASEVLLMTPVGERLRQPLVQELATNALDKILVCARYEGYDERINTIVDRQVSLGDFVLTGGEIPAMALIDSITRLIPGVLGGAQSAEIESFSDGETLEFPQYTRPEDFRGMKVPEVLLSGNHAEIAKWRENNSHSQAK